MYHQKYNLTNDGPKLKIVQKWMTCCCILIILASSCFVFSLASLGGAGPCLSGNI